VLVHICRRWRNLAFGRPGHLNLQLGCKSKTDLKAALDIWPALPIIIDASFKDDADEDDIVGALEDRDRIVGIRLWGLTQSKVKKCLRVMLQPFPVLTSLELHTEQGKATCALVNTDAFLGGSAPWLKRLSLAGIQFSALPTLLSSASELVDLHIGDYPRSGREHISPDAMSRCLSSLTQLRSLFIYFRRSRPEFTYPTTQRAPPSTLAPAVLPALTNLSLGGPHEYLEDLLTRIDTPLLEHGLLDFCDVPNFDHPQISQFIHRTGMFNLPSELDVYIRKCVLFRLQVISSIGPEKEFSMGFSGSDLALNTEVELMEQICTRCPPLLSHIERLTLSENDVEYRYWTLSAPWLEFLQPFTAVQTLRLSGPVIVPGVSRTLGKLAEKRATGVLPALRTVVLEWTREVVSEAVLLVEPYIVARKHSEHPVALKRRPWDDDGSGWDSSDAE